MREAYMAATRSGTSATIGAAASSQGSWRVAASWCTAWLPHRNNSDSAAAIMLAWWTQDMRAG